MGSCACMMGGKCSTFPGGRPKDWVGYLEDKEPYLKDIEDLKSITSEHEHTINHTQEGIEDCFERIENIEDNFRELEIYAKAIQQEAWQVNMMKRIEKIEYILGDVLIKGNPMRIGKKENISNHKKPHKCPVCDGECYRNIVADKVSGLMANPKCLSCEGKGIVWG